MSLKKKLAMSAMTMALGLTLVGGGTFAYFSDTEVTNNTFAAGTLSLETDPSVIIEAEDLKPGDYMMREFELQNGGSLDISDIILHTEYEVIDLEGDNTEDLAEFIEIDFLKNADKASEVILSTTVAELQDMTPDAIQEGLFYPLIGEEGVLEAGDSDSLNMRITFIDNDENQNQFQGDILNLEWTFEAHQMTADEAK